MRRRLTPSLRVAWLLPTLSAAGLLACNATKLDQDGDGFTELTGDCDDLDANVHPDAQEVCYNGIDDNCNGEEDEDDATSGRVWYVDVDGDGYGSDHYTVEACAQPDGFASQKWDCDQDDPEIHPGALEVCDAADNDCDGQVDETTATDAMTWYPDGDGDGYGDPERARVACESPGEGWINDGSDCADGDPLVSPEQTESCVTPYDDDCDGTTNTEGAFACTTFYGDLDGDGFAGTAACLCEAEAPYLETEATDCDDNDSSVYPGGGTVDTEWSDRDCDGMVYNDLADAGHQIASDTTASTAHTFVFPRQASAGDMDGDGRQDLAFSLYGTATTLAQRAVVVVSGAELLGVTSLVDSPTAYLPGEERSPLLGDGMSRAVGQHPARFADMDGDGLDDLVVTNTGSFGDAYAAEASVFLGPVSGTLALDQADGAILFEQTLDSSTTVIEVAGQDQYGRTLIGMGDPRAVTGIDSLMTGTVMYAAWDAEAGGLASAGRQDGLQTEQFFGSGLASVGDIDGDGLDDRVISGDGSVSSTYGERSDFGGVVELYTGVDTFPSAAIVSNRVYRTIQGVTGSGDLNGDGHIDLTLAQSESNLYQKDGGRVHVIWGPIEPSLHELFDMNQLVVYGPEEGAEVTGGAVPDVDGDGRDELFMTAGGLENHRGTEGSALLWFGEDLEGYLIADSGLVQFGTANPDDARFSGTMALLGAGDLDGDGLGDLLIRGFTEGAVTVEESESIHIFFGSVR